MRMGMRPATLVKHLQRYQARSKAVEALPDYEVEPKIGDRVEWKHQTKFLRGTVRHLLEAGDDSGEAREKVGVKKRFWRPSKDWLNSKRAVVEVKYKDKPSHFYVVNYRRLAGNHFRIIGQGHGGGAA